MKKHWILATAAVLALPLGAVAQGQLTWGNVFGSSPNFVTLSRIYGVDPANPTEIKGGNTATGVPPGTQTYGGALLQGTGFTMGLFIGLPGQPLHQRGTALFRTGAAAGLMTPLTPTIQGLEIDTAVDVQLRAWDNRNGTVTSWAQVMADPTVPAGSSSTMAHVLGGFVPGLEINPPVQQTLGVRSFHLTVVPEPSVLALGAFCLGALLLRRRK